jgi:hypothetical protein
VQILQKLAVTTADVQNFFAKIGADPGKSRVREIFGEERHEEDLSMDD